MTTLLETERLIIRSWMPDQDAEQVFEIYNDPEVLYFLGNAARPPSVEVQRQRLIDSLERSQIRKNSSGTWAIIEKDNTKIVGIIMLSQLPDQNRMLTEDLEIGWHLGKFAWGKGYATEAGRAMLDYSFNILNIPVIYAVVKPENYASIRVTQRLDMEFLGRTTKYYGIELLLFHRKSNLINL